MMWAEPTIRNLATLTPGPVCCGEWLCRGRVRRSCNDLTNALVIENDRSALRSHKDGHTTADDQRFRMIHTHSITTN